MKQLREQLKTMSRCESETKMFIRIVHIFFGSPENIIIEIFFGNTFKTLWDTQKYQAQKKLKKVKYLGVF